ncbi:hypothetical protein CDCA_CDCA12G3478 [Cyanidium caldarium]|uniref:PWWP domain-containing protein n=1 Tax=Cyanidium caldarium TaxID=2771 RepID=A0AAV9J0B1_CYACA|nr:hypothetical protein CDCA_CDCA12G3478 [Cyanidium caldarium]|eukprot:ctg_940.g398
MEEMWRVPRRGARIWAPPADHLRSVFRSRRVSFCSQGKTPESDDSDVDLSQDWRSVALAQHPRTSAPHGQETFGQTKHPTGAQTPAAPPSPRHQTSAAHRIGRALSMEEMARLGRAFRERFPQPASALSALNSVVGGDPGGAITDADEARWWGRHGRPASEAWYTEWHAFMTHVRRKLRRERRPVRITFGGAKRWVAKYVPQRRRRVRDSGENDPDANHGARRRARVEDTCMRHGREQAAAHEALPAAWHMPSSAPQRDGTIANAPRPVACAGPCTPPPPGAWWARERFAAGEPVWIRQWPSQGGWRWPGIIARDPLRVLSLSELAAHAPLQNLVLVESSDGSAAASGGHCYRWVGIDTVESMLPTDAQQVCAQEFHARRTDSPQQQQFERALKQVLRIAEQWWRSVLRSTSPSRSPLACLPRAHPDTSA